ncbi:MAG: hypothetical protein IPJ34_00310 [Myxococcales bacterium]|nr:hypothetical protein [Myxococcales bacterium]
MRNLLAVLPLLALTACTVRVVDHTNSPRPAPAPAAAPPPVAPAPGPAVAPAPAPAPGPGPVVGAPVSAGVDQFPVNQPVVTEYAPPPTPPQPTNNSVASGQPPHLHPSAPAAYWIWRDSNGWWHVRTTTKKYLHRFHGTVKSVGGNIAMVKGTRLEMNDRLKTNGKALWFAFDTQGHLDGFDFTTSDNQCVTFNLSTSAGKAIYVGAGEVQPSTGYFTVCP